MAYKIKNWVRKGLVTKINKAHFGETWCSSLKFRLSEFLFYHVSKSGSALRISFSTLIEKPL